ncbi:hypothetical protein RBA41_28715 [Massilia sp. CCM 9210]|uniref:hypothetical protein n=1 Tax=Massilia scottii TaxID=3057166 RepID=UPI0027967E30|nr:hypothetical protein [Massilia sp. CCM 9210]MDQ1817295.1 hypothetical protein [Massilia sp. CCM 9210]
MSPKLNARQSAFSKFKKKPAKPKEKKTFSISAKISAFFSIIAAFLALIGTTLALIGEGVAMAVESTVEIPHHLLIGSSFDYIELSLWAAVQMLNSLTDKPPEYLYIEIFLAILPATIAMVVFFVIIIMNRHNVVRLQKARFYTRILAVFQPPKPADSNAMLIAKSGLVGAVFNAGFPAILVLGLGIFFGVIGLLTTPTTIGLQFGKAHIQKYVVSPLECAPIRNRNALLKQVGKKQVGNSKTTYAQCVAVANDRRDFGRGRVVLTTSTAIILWDPDTGHGWRVPVKDASIETVDSLTVPSKATISGILKGQTLLEVERGNATSSPALLPAPGTRVINK